MWSGVSSILPALMQLRPFVPSMMKKAIDQMILPTRLNQGQYDRISELGRSIGLTDRDINAALDAPGAELSSDGMPKLALLASAVIVVIAAAITVIGLWHLISPETSPIPTYAPGTAYGTIKPTDFDELLEASIHTFGE